jgi:hypothetical protein
MRAGGKGQDSPVLRRCLEGPSRRTAFVFEYLNNRVRDMWHPVSNIRRVDAEGRRHVLYSRVGD